MRLLVVLTAVLGLALAVSARAGERVALVIANAAYVSAPALPAVPGSAAAVRDALRDAGFSVTVASDLGQDQFGGALARFFSSRAGLGRDDIVLVYYLGYAAQHDGRNYLMPVDADPSSRDVIPTAGLRLDPEPDGTTDGPVTVVILDAAATDGWGKVKGERGLARVNPGGNEIFAFAAEPGTIAAPASGPLTAFAETFIAALQPGIGVETLVREVKSRVTDLTDGRQQPWWASGLAHAVSLVPEAATAQAPGGDMSPTDLPDTYGDALGGASPEPSAPASDGSVWDDFANLGGTYSDDLDAAEPPAASQEDLLAQWEAMKKEQEEAERRAEAERMAMAERQAAEAERQAEAARQAEAERQAAEQAARGPDLSNSLGSAQPSPDVAGSQPPDIAGSSDFAGAAPPDFDSLDLGGQGPMTEAPMPSAPPEASPGAGGNPYLDLMTMSEPEAWARVSATTDPLMYQVYLLAFPSGAHAGQASAAFAIFSGAVAAADPGLPTVAAPDSGPPPAEAAPTAVAPAPAVAETRVERHPMLDAPEEVVAAESFSVTVALTEEKLTPEVSVKAAPTTEVTREGALSFALPAGSEEWPIDIDLLAAGFELADGGKWSRRVTLYNGGDSDPARFELKARPIQEDARPRQIVARFYHSGRFLGSASRPVTVLRDGTVASASGPAAMSVAAVGETLLASTVRVDGQVEVPDLDVTVHYDDPDHLGAGLIVIHSPHIPGPVSAEFSTPAGMTEWLDAGYSRLVQLGLQLRGAKSLTEPQPMDAESQRVFIARVAEGLGDDLYRNYVPQPFKDVFWSLRDRGILHSIQITSNSPVLPWELVRPRKAEGAAPDGFLGISYRLARWAPRSDAGQVDQPLDRMRFTGVATVAPSYQNNQELPFQQTEIAALSKLNGFRLVGGDFSAFEKMIGEVSTGFIHFSGHGEVNDPGDGRPVFAIRLTDQSLDPNTWRALKFAPHDRGNPFYFFNACDTGRAASLGGFVQGWGPAVLATGASGFIGGMWPLTDRTAAAFSTEFYDGVAGHLGSGPVYLAGVLQDVRNRFYDTGDPTYLAYTFYGNANLQVVAQ